MNPEEAFSERAKQESVRRLKRDLGLQVLDYETNLSELNEREPAIHMMEAMVARIQEELEAEGYPRQKLKLSFPLSWGSEMRHTVYFETELLKIHGHSSNQSFVAYPVAIGPESNPSSRNFMPYDITPTNFNVIYIVPSLSQLAVRSYSYVEGGSRMIQLPLTVEELEQARAELEAEANGVNIEKTVLTHLTVVPRFNDEQLTIWDYRRVFSPQEDPGSAQFLKAADFDTINKQLREYRVKKNGTVTLSFQARDALN